MNLGGAAPSGALRQNTFQLDLLEKWKESKFRLITNYNEYEFIV